MKLRYTLLIPAALAVLGWAYIQGNINGAGMPATPAAPGATPDSPAVSVVTGVVKLDGPAPAMKSINMIKDPVCMKMHAGGASTEEIVTGPNQTLGNVVVFVSEGLGDRKFDPPSQPVTLNQKTCMYQPHVLALQANQKLQIVNSDPTSHNIHPLPINNREWNKSQPPGEPPIEATFAREEIAIPVKCNEHPWMRSYIAVFKHPFFNVTAKDGRFELKNLPPGEYTISAWHEKLGTVEQKITVGPKETKTVDFVFKVRRAFGAGSAQ